MNYLMTHSTHFIYGNIWKITRIAREETRCRHMGYTFRLPARVLLYASSHRKNNTYHGLCYSTGWNEKQLNGPTMTAPSVCYRFRSDCSYSLVPASAGVPPPTPPYSLTLFFLSRTEEPAKAGTCARDRRTLQQLALNVHVKHPDLTMTDRSDDPSLHERTLLPRSYISLPEG